MHLYHYNLYSKTGVGYVYSIFNGHCCFIDAAHPNLIFTMIIINIYDFSTL